MPIRKPKVTLQSTTYRIYSNPEIEVTLSHKDVGGGKYTFSISLSATVNGKNRSLGTKHWTTNRPFTTFTQVIAGVKTTKGVVKRNPITEIGDFEELATTFEKNPENLETGKALFSFIVEHMPGQNDEAIAAIRKLVGVGNLDEAIAIELSQRLKIKANQLIKQAKSKKQAEADEKA